MTSQRRGLPRGFALKKIPIVALHRLLTLTALVVVLIRFDILIFGYRSSFFEFREFPLYRIFRKTVIYVFHGSDARPPYIDGSLMALERGLTTSDCIALTRQTKAAVGKIERVARAVVSHPPYGQFHERPFISLLSLGLPTPTSTEIRRPTVREASPSHDAVRVLHAPSHPAAKGTERIRASVAEVSRRGRKVELVEITEQPNHVVLRELLAADFVVDQVYSDLPMPVLATEAAAIGRPTVVAGYEASRIRAAVPGAAHPPTLFVSPTDLTAAIEHLAKHPAEREQLGASARQFVEEQWAPVTVAARFLLICEGREPPEWRCEPDSAEFLHGSGLDADRARSVIREIVNAGGSEALQVADKPHLEKNLLEFAGSPMSVTPRTKHPDDEP